MAFSGSNAQRRYYSHSSESPSVANLMSGGFSASASNRDSSNASLSPYDVSPFLSRSPSVVPTVTDKFSLSPDPAAWGSNLSPEFAEEDDYLHNPDPRLGRKSDRSGQIFSYRGLSNIGCLLILSVGLLALFAGYPITSYFTTEKQSNLGGFNIGGINATGQVSTIPGKALIDPDTPEDVYTKKSYVDSSQDLQLVFSDEFNVDGRSFYPGDDPYWEAVDMHYWPTNNIEWYDPAAITTNNGSLEITLSKKSTHGLDYQGGMIASWNKFCFTGGLVETSVTLPGSTSVAGLWPAVWALGNLGRAGYGASLEGLWPYTYDACDVGTAPNQTYNGLPTAATINGDPSNGDVLSYLQGQRLSRCTCSGESHPGPVHSDGTYVGRSAPEIDIFEATVSGTPLSGQVSQSAQWAPFNYEYTWLNTSDTYSINNSTVSILNSYKGGAFQQATSVLTDTNQECYELTGGCFATYGFEYKPGFDTGYITWIANGVASWTIKSTGLAADTTVEISDRPVPEEPMYLIANLGMSENFGTVDLDNLVFPTTMRIDWIRVYQPSDSINIGCDPTDFPTAAYINEYAEAYANVNLTTWVDDYNQTVPKNSFLGQC